MKVVGVAIMAPALPAIPALPASPAPPLWTAQSLGVIYYRRSRSEETKKILCECYMETHGERVWLMHLWSWGAMTRDEWPAGTTEHDLIRSCNWCHRSDFEPYYSYEPESI